MRIWVIGTTGITTNSHLRIGSTHFPVKIIGVVQMGPVATLNVLNVLTVGGVRLRVVPR